MLLIYFFAFRNIWLNVNLDAFLLMEMFGSMLLRCFLFVFFTLKISSIKKINKNKNCLDNLNIYTTVKRKEILLSNGYSNKFIDKCISKFMNKLYIKKPAMLTVPRKQLYLVLPFMRKMSALVKSGLTRSLQKRLPFYKVKIVFKTCNRLKNCFSFKDVVPEPLRSCQIYNFTCGNCNASYIGKAFRYMKVRVSEHQGVSPLTGKHLKKTL